MKTCQEQKYGKKYFPAKIAKQNEDDISCISYMCIFFKMPIQVIKTLIVKCTIKYYIFIKFSDFLNLHVYENIYWKYVWVP